MAKPISETQVREAVIYFLRTLGYSIVDPKEKSQHGVDIRARHIKYWRFFIVEAKGDPIGAKFPDSSRTSCFWTAIGQIVTRMNTLSRNYYGVAFPESYAAKVKNLPWQFCKKNQLSVFLVGSNGKIKHLTHKELRENHTVRLSS